MPGMKASTLMPWWFKISAKLLLSRLPVPAAAWQRVGLFRHGTMDDLTYPTSVFRSHARRAGISSLSGLHVLEIGPGNSIATAVIAAAHGSTAVLVDAGDFATRDLGFYRQLAISLENDGLVAPDLKEVTSLEEILEKCGARYLTNGLMSLSDVDTSSVDLVFSQAVLEHVRLGEFEETMEQLSRILTTDGMASHRVDLHDHLGGGLNNLRFSPRVWESEFFARSGFYTNRMSLSQMRVIFERTYSYVDITPSRGWTEPPLSRSRMHRTFRPRSDEELCVSGFDALLSNRS